MKKKFTVISFILISFFFSGWGKVGHNIINTNTVLCFPPELNEFVSWSSVLAQHASDADYRKSDDPAESPKHYIDIEDYPEFNSTGRIIQDYDSVTAKYGSSRVIGIGILPWAIINTFDSLKAQFKRRDWSKAQLTAADLGHYIADSHMPLHITKNYNGQLSGQYGIHSRYETSMIGKYQNLIQYSGNTAVYVSNVSGFVFSYIYGNYSYVDSVLNSDKAAASFAGNTSSDAYYQKLWELTGGFTIHLFSEASYRLACLIYTAWVDAGSPSMSVSSLNDVKGSPKDFVLYQNYPNPFNPSTVIKYRLPESGRVKLEVYNITGFKICTLLNEFQSTGEHSVTFDINNYPNRFLSSGVYFYRITAGKYLSTQKMELLK